MTPSEKKAEEICRVIWTRALSEDSADEDVKFVEDAIDEAERRGFERAKRMAIKTLQDYDCIYLLENLKYEEA